MTKELREQIDFDMKVLKKFQSIRSSAQNRNKEFGLTLKEIAKLMKTKRCFFTGVELNNISGDKHKLTFDRVDNDKGYVVGNVVACTHEFNQIKGNLTIQQVKLIMKGFKKKKLIK